MSFVLSSRVFRLLLLLIVLAVLGTLWRTRTLAPSIGSENDASLAAANARNQWDAVIEAQFAGDQSCQECHAEEFAAHQRSGHSQTAFRMENTTLAEKLDGTQYTDAADGRVVRFALEEAGFFAESELADEKVRLRVDWLLGSSAHAQTAVSILPQTNSGVEHFWTWFAHRDELGRTPGQPDFHAASGPIDTCEGRQMTGKDVTHCFSCHMTFGPAPGQELSEVRWHPNISCERCHGPRRLHAEAAHQGRAEAVKPMVTLKDPAVEMALCAQCHRGTAEVDSSIAESDRVRFQPYRLEQSRCFQANPVALTCVTCHDPHDATSHDIAAYRNVCLSCHSQPDQTHCGAISTEAFSEANCASCHMPEETWSGGIQFVDHWIRVVNDKKGAE